MPSVVEHINVILVLLVTLLIFFVITITIRSRVYCVIFLILSYALAAIIAALLSFPFIAVAILIIYVGAISVFFLFIVMSLSEQKIVSHYSRDFFIALAFFIVLVALNIYAVWLFFTTLDGSYLLNFSPWLKTADNTAAKFFFFDRGLYYWVTSGNFSDYTGDFVTSNSFVEFKAELDSQLKAVDGGSCQVQDKNFFKIAKLAEFISKDPSSSWLTDVHFEDSNLTTRDSNFGISTKIAETNDIFNVGMVLYTRFATGVITSGLLLLLAIIGVTTIFNVIPKSNKSREIIIEQTSRIFQKGPK